MTHIQLAGTCFVAGVLVLLCLAQSAGCFPVKYTHQRDLVAVSR